MGSQVRVRVPVILQCEPEMVVEMMVDWLCALGSVGYCWMEWWLSVRMVLHLAVRLWAALHSKSQSHDR